MEECKCGGKVKIVDYSQKYIFVRCDDCNKYGIMPIHFTAVIWSK